MPSSLSMVPTSSATRRAMPPVATTPIVGGELGGDAPLVGAAENFVKSGYAEISD